MLLVPGDIWRSGLSFHSMQSPRGRAEEQNGDVYEHLKIQRFLGTSAESLASWDLDSLPFLEEPDIELSINNRSPLHNHQCLSIIPKYQHM